MSLSVGSLLVSAAEARVENYSPGGQPPVFVNKVLLAPGHAHLVTYYLRLFSAMTVELTTYDPDWPFKTKLSQPLAYSVPASPESMWRRGRAPLTSSRMAVGLGRRACWGWVGAASSSESESSRSLRFLDSSTKALREGTWDLGTCSVAGQWPGHHSPPLWCTAWLPCPDLTEWGMGTHK